MSAGDNGKHRAASTDRLMMAELKMQSRLSCSLCPVRPVPGIVCIGGLSAR